MPVDFLTTEQELNYSRYVAEPNDVQLAAIHYLAELNGSKKRILDDAPEHIITGPCKRLVYDAEARYNATVIHCVCWSAFRMHCADGTSG